MPCVNKKRSVSALTGIATFFHGGGPGKTSVREVLERPDGRWSRASFQGEMLVISELSDTAHALRSPSCPPSGTDLVALRDEFARAVTAAWCWWSFARVTSARLGRSGSVDVAFALVASEGIPQLHHHPPLLSPQAIVNTFFIHSSGCHHVSRSPPIAVFRMCGGAQVQNVSRRWCRAGGSDSLAPGPADPEMDIRARQLHRGKDKTRTSNRSVARGTSCTARDRARCWWSGGWPKVCVQLAVNPIGVFCQCGTQKCSPNASLCPVSAWCSGFLCCLSVCSSWCEVLIPCVAVNLPSP